MVVFAVVGLPDKAVAESRERVRASISALGLALPPKRITINLSPADLPKEGSAEVAARVRAARNLQSFRLADTRLRTNADVYGDALAAFATPDAAGQKLLAQAAGAMRLSARGYTRIFRVARTIADLSSALDIGRVHIAEALS